MLCKEDSKKIRQEFWIFFGKRHPRKWLLYNTGIKDVALKFSLDTREAMISIDATSNDSVLRTYYFEKLEQLRHIMREEISSQLVFNTHYTLDSGKTISRVYLKHALCIRKSITSRKACKIKGYACFLNFTIAVLC